MPSIIYKPTEKVLLKAYPTYKLYGKVFLENFEEYKKSKDKTLILYRFCENERLIPPPDVKLGKHTLHSCSRGAMYKADPIY